MIAGLLRAAAALAGIVPGWIWAAALAGAMATNCAMVAYWIAPSDVLTMTGDFSASAALIIACSCSRLLKFNAPIA